MLKNYELDAEDKEIINELDNLYGVVQNKDILKDIIVYTKLKQNNKIDFGNYNIIIRNDSSYDLLNDFIKVCAKIFMKYKIISNDKICWLDKNINRRYSPFDNISGIEEGIIVINERKLRITYSNEIDNLIRIINQFKDKVFIFEDTNYCEGEIDAELGDIASWRMTIKKISLEDKLIYCKNKFEINEIKFKKQDLKEYVDVPFWMLKNMTMKLLIDCKSKKLDFVDKQMLKKNREQFIKNKNIKRNYGNKIKKEEKSAKKELNELIGLSEIKKQMEKILNYIKLNKERGEMPSLHMCFTGNPGTGKTSMARIIGKIFEEEKILSGSGEFVEIHGRDLVAKYVGWTAQQVHDIVEKAIGGVLFIDEAYSLVNDRKGGFEDEAIATLIKEMEDHRNEICIILAGYTNEIEDLIRQNPGFESRIQFIINFPDYSEEELLSIFTNLCKKEHYKLSKVCQEILIENFKKAKKQQSFGNGRYVRNLFEKIKFEQADRVIKENANKDTIKKEDILLALENFNKKEERKENKIGFGA